MAHLLSSSYVVVRVVKENHDLSVGGCECIVQVDWTVRVENVYSGSFWQPQEMSNVDDAAHVDCDDCYDLCLAVFTCSYCGLMVRRSE